MPYNRCFPRAARAGEQNGPSSAKITPITLLETTDKLEMGINPDESVDLADVSLKRLHQSAFRVRWVCLGWSKKRVSLAPGGRSSELIISIA
jgi:hypothetical protein